jgi:hypothetical protein
MQLYQDVPDTTTLTASRLLLLDNILTSMSCSSGTVFPTTSLQIGMPCFRTDLKKLYQLVDLTPTWLLIGDFTSGTCVVPQAASILGWIPVQQGGGTNQGTNKVYIGWAADTSSKLVLQIDTTSFGSTWPISITGDAATLGGLAAAAYETQSHAAATYAALAGLTSQAFSMSTAVPSSNTTVGASTGFVVGTPKAYVKGQSGAIVVLTDAATVVIDLSLANNFALLLTSTIGATRALGIPTNMVPGQSGLIAITQDTIGSRLLTYSSTWKFAGGLAPTLSTAANAVDYLAYYVETSARIYGSIVMGVA